MKKGKLLLIVMSVMVASGCSVRDKKDPTVIKNKKQATEISVVSDTMDDAVRMERCRRELDALKKVNNKVYEERKLAFDDLMSGAGIYTGVREDVSSYTQQAIDAYYRYHADKLCADISIDVLSNLSRAK
ncbi:hypothetical protein HP809_003660 [Salmonella enterica subsp. enterica serovar Richmond]|nr:hypothetical protein [Salmonella enterica]EBR9918834.1 hypothetical protein [Salmonella enterica subsp. enterica serovar Richmond]EBV8115668.1 hypothetical protein [Salmonella enterica subsp. enterica serovar Baildon]ECY4325420.1 hypothetical protein [Salmonella enterica subsp. enterica serovar Enteritidis]EEA9091998.1 hypothetical protein [Salmonella enterica subsp. enterica]EIC4014497.1 hypothetical protein [Salmonella enterica subsp. enterica serovar Amager]